MYKTEYNKLGYMSPKTYKRNDPVSNWVKKNREDFDESHISVINPKPNNLYLEINEASNKHYIKLDKKLVNIYEEILKSKYMLEFEDNWDDEGSKAYDIETWNRAISFLACNAQFFLSRYGEIIDTPIIAHSLNGSIDIYWKNKDFYLLINIPQNIEESATYYGKNLNTNEHAEGSKKLDVFPLYLCLQTLK